MSVTALLHRYNNNNRNERLGLLNKQFMLVLNGRTNIQFINQKTKIKTFSAKYSIHRQLCSKFKCGKQIEVAFYGTELCSAFQRKTGHFQTLQWNKYTNWYIKTQNMCWNQLFFFGKIKFQAQLFVNYQLSKLGFCFGFFQYGDPCHQLCDIQCNRQNGRLEQACWKHRILIHWVR